MAGLPDNQLTASSYFGDSVAPFDSRLNDPKSWSAGQTDTNPHILADLSALRQITAVATQGRGNGDEWVTSYTIWHSTDNSRYHTVSNIFAANSDRNTVVEHDMVPTITARYLRLHPLAWHSWPSLRWEIYGCAYTGMVHVYCLQLQPAVWHVVDCCRQ